MAFGAPKPSNATHPPGPQRPPVRHWQRILRRIGAAAQELVAPDEGPLGRHHHTFLLAAVEGIFRPF